MALDKPIKNKYKKKGSGESSLSTRLIIVNFTLHFLKEKTRQIDLDALFSFFQNIPGFTINTEYNRINIHYELDFIDAKADFYITEKTTINNIYRLDAKYRDLNFHLQISAFMNDFIAEKIFLIVQKLVKEFDLYIYNDLFDNVLPYRFEFLKASFEIIKKTAKEHDSLTYEKYHYLDKAILNSIYQYEFEREDIFKYYQEEIAVPTTQFIKTTEEIFVACVWKAGERIVFPPFVKYIIYQNGIETKLIDFQLIEDKLHKYLIPLPGFNNDIRMTSNQKKVRKIMNKTRFEASDLNYNLINIGELIDT